MVVVVVDKNELPVGCQCPQKLRVERVILCAVWIESARGRGDRPRLTTVSARHFAGRSLWRVLIAVVIVYTCNVEVKKCNLEVKLSDDDDDKRF